MYLEMHHQSEISHMILTSSAPRPPLRTASRLLTDARRGGTRLCAAPPLSNDATHPTRTYNILFNIFKSCSGATLMYILVLLDTQIVLIKLPNIYFNLHALNSHVKLPTLMKTICFTDTFKPCSYSLKQEETLINNANDE